MSAEFAKLAREASAANEDYEQYLLRLTELEVAARSANALQGPDQAGRLPGASRTWTPTTSAAVPALNKQKVLELARGEWIDQHFNCLPDRQPGHGQDPPGHRSGPGRLPAGPTGAVLHRRGPGQSVWRRPRSSTAWIGC